MTTEIIPIPDRPSHDALRSHAESTDAPTVIYVSNSAQPRCRAFSPQYEAVAAKFAAEDVAFANLEYTRATHDISKFAPTMLPVLVLLRRGWCRTLMSPTQAELEEGVRGLLARGKGVEELR